MANNLPDCAFLLLKLARLPVPPLGHMKNQSLTDHSHRSLLGNSDPNHITNCGMAKVALTSRCYCFSRIASVYHFSELGGYLRNGRNA
jgi:hypothetical protein